MIDIFAVIGTSLFMMALATVWYSPFLFGRQWMKEVGLTEAVLEEKESESYKHMILTFVSYSVLLSLLSLVVAYAPKLSIDSLYIAGGITLFVAALGVPSVLSEGKSLRYYMIQTGFYVVFIMTGVAMLEYWPW